MTRTPAPLAVALLACAIAAPAARADVSAPVQLAAGQYINAAADTDGAGTTSVVVAGPAGGPLLVQRAPGATWQPGAPLPGAPRSVVGPVLDAAGDGALAIAWRVDRPRAYSGIVVAVRDPHGSVSEPIAVAGPEADGVRHPAVAVDGAGDVLLAYNSATHATHLNRQGAIAVVYRRGGGAFSRPVVVDGEPSSAPAVALAPDGTGIVAWTRRQHVYAVSLGADGSVGTVKAFSSSTGSRNLLAAAGDGGAATLSWTHRRTGRRTTRTYVRALRRGAGHGFGSPAVVATTTEYLRATAMAVDENGRVTLAWSEEHFGDDRSVGENGITSAIRAATAAPGHSFAAARVVAPRRAAYLMPPTIAAAAGRVALAWGYVTDAKHVGVQAAVGPASLPQAPQTVVAKTLTGPTYADPAFVRVALGRGTAATVLYPENVQTGNPPIFSARLLAADVTAR